MADYPPLTPKKITLYLRDAHVQYHGRSNAPDVQNERQTVKQFTRKSRRRLAFVASNTAVVFTSMATLTYPAKFPSDGRTVKKNLNHMLTIFRRRYPTIEYLWWLEFQQRHAPHFHLLLTHPTGSLTHVERLWLSERWFNVVKSGDKKHLLAGTNWQKIRSQNGARNYAVQYAQKWLQKAVPPKYTSVGRLWAHSRNVKPLAVASMELESREQLEKVIEGWQYAEQIRGKNVSVLYNYFEFEQEKNPWLKEAKIDKD